MVWVYHGERIPLETYHGVPEGWSAAEVFEVYARLGGRYDISGPDATEPGAPSWLPNRRSWLQYREVLYRISDGVFFDDPACVELAVRYIELHHIGSYSGYLRSRLSRRLRYATLNCDQRKRLHAHFAEMVLDGNRTNEFTQYLKLWRKFAAESDIARLVVVLVEQPMGDERVSWLLSHLRDGPR